MSERISRPKKESTTQIPTERRTRARKEVQRPIITDIPTLFRKFWRSEPYRTALAKFKEGKPTTIPNERYKRTFNDSEEAKAAFLEYTEHKVKFIYDETQLPQDVVEAMHKYVDFVRDVKAKQETIGLQASEIEQLDMDRRLLHNEVANLLDLQQITPSRRLGRALASEILIQNGLETYQNARQSEFHGIRRLIS